MYMVNLVCHNTLLLRFLFQILIQLYRKYEGQTSQNAIVIVIHVLMLETGFKRQVLINYFASF